MVADAAADLAGQLEGQVAVICVDEVETELLSTLPREHARERAEATAQRVVDRLREAGVEATKTVRSGSALERILEYADEIDADVIVVGSSVKGRLRAALLGSVPVGSHPPLQASCARDHRPEPVGPGGARPAERRGGLSPRTGAYRRKISFETSKAPLLAG